MSIRRVSASFHSTQGPRPKRVMSWINVIKPSWIDQKLKWNPDDYGGVDVLYVPSELLWLPDIVLYNNADGNYQISIMTKAKLSPNGTVLWEPPAIFKSMCQIEVEWFPFDDQICTLIFGSWTYSGLEVDLKHKDSHLQREDTELVMGYEGEYAEKVWIVDKGIDLSDYYPSVEWDILRVPGKRHEKLYPCCESPFVDLTYEIHLRRKNLFYFINLIIPSVGISFLTALVFYLPSDGGEKISLCISILISLTVFFLLLVEIIPSTSLVIPLIGKYLLFTMVMVTLSVIVTVITLNVHYRSASTHTMSKLTRRVFLDFLPRLLCMKRKVKTLHKSEDGTTTNGDNRKVSAILHQAFSIKKKNNNRSNKASDSRPSFCRPRASFGVYDRKYSTRSNHTSALFEQMDYLSPHYTTSANLNSGSSSSIANAATEDNTIKRGKLPFGLQIDNDPQTSSTSHNATEKPYTPIQSAVDSVTYIADHLKNEEEDQQITEDWKYISVVMDRVFLIIFTLACFMGIILIILRAPTIYDTTIPLA
uniref:Neur_chan_LBD domain-containing protein n=1 Tax=Rhabditophanes sp. KR3021 TaxID=114890 RepID=A0AC35TXV8_9BILA